MKRKFRVYKDFEGDCFDTSDIIVFGILVPICFVITIGVAGWLASMLERL